MIYIVKFIVAFLYKNNAITKEDEPIYIYGTEIVLNFLSVTTTFLILGLLLGEFLNTILFITFFTTLRGCAGGYHASSPIKCYLTSVFTYLIVFSCILFMNDNIKNLLALPMLILGDIILILFSPTQNKVNIKTDLQIKYNKLKMYKIMFVLNIIFFMYFINGFNIDISFMISFVIIAISILGIFNLFKNKKTEEEFQ